MKYMSNKLLLILFFTSSILSFYGHADEGYAIAAFRDGCLNSTPDYSGASDIFKKYGFSTPTSDKLVLEWKGVGYAGFGLTAKEGAEDKPYSNGCFVYLRGTPLIKVATTVNFLLKEKKQNIRNRQVGNDLYWMLPKVNGNTPLVIVSEKDSGQYAGHVMMMLTEIN